MRQLARSRSFRRRCTQRGVTRAKRCERRPAARASMAPRPRTPRRSTKALAIVWPRRLEAIVRRTTRAHGRFQQPWLGAGARLLERVLRRAASVGGATSSPSPWTIAIAAGSNAAIRRVWRSPHRDSARMRSRRAQYRRSTDSINMCRPIGPIPCGNACCTHDQPAALYSPPFSD